MIRILIHGYSGRLGSAIRGLLSTEEFRDRAMVCAGVSLDANVAHMPFPTFKDLNECDMPCDCIIDCSTAGAVDGVAAFAVEHRIPLLVCTTGLSGETVKGLAKAAEVIPVFRSANMSFGINLIKKLALMAAKSMPEADIEIVERHHNKKVDAPSGTALLLAEALEKSTDGDTNIVYGRGRESGKREKGEIGVHAIRGGGIVGEHTVIVAVDHEVIEIKHTAVTKDVFAQGAVKAALFITKKPNGLYNMDDLFDEIGKELSE